MPFDTSQQPTDEALLARFADGDMVAARVLTQRLGPRAMAHAYRLTGNRDEAEDVTQEAMIRLWRIAPEWRVGEARLTTWLYRVVANLCTDRLRRRRTMPLDAVDEPSDPRPAADEEMVARARAAALQVALNRLPERQRQAVVLRHIEGLSNPEIAQIMQIGVEAVESLTARGKRALTAELEDRKEALGFS